MRRAALVFSLTLSLAAAAAELTLISQGLFGPGNGDSGYRNDPFSFSFSTAPIANDGTVYFISQATNLDIDATFEFGQDWDIFMRAPGGEAIAVSLRIDAAPGIREGQATSLALVSDRLVSIRDNTLADPSHQHLILRETVDLGSATDIATGSDEFFHPRFSRNGDFLVFAASDNSADPSDDNQRRDIFVQTFGPDSLTRVSIRPLSLAEHIPRDALFPDISNDGQHVVFESGDDAFVAEDNNLSTDIFYLNREADSIIRLNTRLFDADDGRGLETGPCHQPTIDGNATTILYTSADPAIVLGDTNNANDVFAYSVSSGQTQRISAIDGQAAGTSEHPQINQSGRFIVFRSNATNFPQANGAFQIYLFDTASASLEAISLNAAGAPANADCFAPHISPDGRYITFSTAASNLDSQTDGNRQVFLADRGANFLNIRPKALPVDVYCATNSGSPLGLVGEDAESASNSLRFRFRNLPSAEQGSIRLLDYSPVTTTDTYTSAEFPIIFIPAQDYLGSSILEYEVIDENDAVSLPATISIFVNNFSNGIFEIVSVGDRAFGTPAGQRRAMIGENSADSPVFSADSISLSADGRFASFASNANNLTADSQQGIFIRDIEERRTKLIEPIVGGMLIHRPTLSACANALLHVQIGTPTVLIHHSLDAEGNAISRSTTEAASNFHVPLSLAISENGETVLFAKPNQPSEIYAWRPAGDSITRVSDETSACTQPAISPDGHWAAFVVAESANDVIRLVHLHNGAVETVSEDGIDLSSPSLSRSGRYLAVQAGDNAFVLDRDTDTRTVRNSAGNVAISANGRFLYLTDTQNTQALRVDWGDGSTRLISNNADAPITAGAFSGNATQAIFATTAANLTNDPETRSDVFTINLGSIPNSAPNASGASTTIDEDSSGPIALLVADPEGDDMLIEIIEPPAHGSLTFIASGSLTYTPDLDYAGTDSFMWRAHDSSAFSSEATVSIAVRNLNDPPSIGSIADLSVNEGDTLSFDLTVSDPDPDETVNITASHGGVDNNAYNFAVPYDIATAGSTPVALEITLRATDLAGASDSQVFTLTVHDVNVAPSADSANLTPAVPRTTDDLTLSYVYADFDGDPEGATSIVWYRDSVEFATDTLIIPATSTLRGEEWYAEITARDDRGAVGATVTLPKATITNSVPRVAPQTLSLNEDSSVAIALSAQDDDGDSLIVNYNQPTHGVFDGTRYIPERNFSGSDSFSYSAFDGADSASATITLIVNGQLDPPVLSVRPAFISTSANSAILDISLSDPDEPGGITAADYTLTLSQPTTGVLQGVSGPITAQALPITFVPNGGFSDEVITVSATDGTGLNSGIRNLRIVNDVRFQSLRLKTGWNLVCLTRDSLDFPFENAFGWDVESQQLTALSTSARGRGFWTHVVSDVTIDVPGRLTATSPLDVKLGWNLIGGIGEGDVVPVPNAADITWRWKGYFTQADNLFTGEAVWMHFPADSSVNLELSDR